ncbi:unnamed protein product [Ilex paraguariensis]|uniref:HMA domain-containing protein n=1 Tax=Ilex paraguariensis TaxID=185542 RepID=A0ABC8QR36_9AQUA
MAASGFHQVRTENYAFMTCVLRVNTRSQGWQKTLMNMLNSVQGVSNFRMNEDGMVKISGTVNPNHLLKMLAKGGKRAEMCWFQFGECSSNLYMPDQRTYYDCTEYGYCGDDWLHGYGEQGYYGGYGGTEYYGDDRYLHYGDRPRPKHRDKPLQPLPCSHGAMGPRHIASAPDLNGEGISGCCHIL